MVFKLWGWIMIMVNCVIKDWIFSQVSMKSGVKNSYLLQLLIVSWWFEVLMCLCKKCSRKATENRKSLNVMLPLLLNQIFKNKSEAEKGNQRFFEEALLLLWRKLTSLSILAWKWKWKVEPDDES